MATKTLVVIGAVAAGTSAAAKAKRTNPNLDVILLERDRHISYGACGLPYLIAGLIPGTDALIARTPAEFGERGVEVRTEHEVLEIDTANTALRVADLAAAQEYSLRYDDLVIATGAVCSTGSMFSKAPDIAMIFLLFAAMGFVGLFTSLFFHK